MRTIFLGVAIGGLFGMSGGLSAQDLVPSNTSDHSVSSVDCSCGSVPALTPVSIEILAPLGSKTSKTGETFPIRLAVPLEFDGKTLVAAGAAGMGEVVHAKGAGGTGSPGELVLAARYLEVAGKRLRLRSLNFSQAGENRYKSADTLTLAAAATIPAASILVFAIKGKDIVVPNGTIAGAKTAESFVLTAAEPALPITTTDTTGEKK